MGTKDRAKEDVERKVHLKIWEFAANNLFAVAGAMVTVFAFSGAIQFLVAALWLLGLTLFTAYRGLD